MITLTLVLICFVIYLFTKILTKKYKIQLEKKDLEFEDYKNKIKEKFQYMEAEKTILIKTIEQLRKEDK